MKKYLITVTLLNSFQYYMNSEYSKREDFISLLRKDKFEPTEAQEKGLDFESDIQKVEEAGKLLPENHEYERIVNDFAIILKGCLWQYSLSKEIEMNGNSYVLYGRADAIKRDTIFDIKYTKSYDLGKFFNSMQHKIELACTDCDKFDYLISDFKDKWTETYHKTGNELNEVKQCLAQFLQYLERDEEAKELFEKNWVSNY